LIGTDRESCGTASEHALKQGDLTLRWKVELPEREVHGLTLRLEHLTCCIREVG